MLVWALQLGKRNSIQIAAKVGVHLSVFETQGSFLYYYLLTIVLYSEQTTLALSFIL